MTGNFPARSPRRTGLYLHIPFCRVKCHYCNFVITLDRSAPMRERFLGALEKEISAARARYGNLSFETIYFGGGTPSALDSGEFSRVVSALRSSFSFNTLKEFTVEINPGDVDAEKIRAFKELGVNRASVGAQAFQQTLLEKMGRPHGASEIHETVKLLKKEGIENISLDLIFRLPGQDVNAFCSSLDEALSLEPAQLTLYDLEVHEKTRFGLMQKKGELALPDEDAHFEMFEKAAMKLKDAGYRHYELLSFARPGFESRHNRLYWENQDYLGLGPGAFSYLEGTRYQFSESVHQYLKKCEAGDWVPAVSDVLTPEKKEVESLLTGMRLEEGVDLRDFPLIRESLRPAIEELARDGLIETRDSRIALTFKGRALAETALLRLTPGL